MKSKQVAGALSEDEHTEKKQDKTTSAEASLLQALKKEVKGRRGGVVGWPVWVPSWTGPFKDAPSIMLTL